MEAAEVLCGPTMSRFDWSDPTGSRFYLWVEDDVDPIDEVLKFLSECEVAGVVPERASEALDMKKWKQPTVVQADHDGFPMAVPSAPAMLPARLWAGTRQITVHHWGDTTTRDNVKFWGGAGGLPGAVILSNTLGLVRTRLREARQDPFSLGLPLSSSFRLDWRRDYIPSESGFSLNAHGNIEPIGYPIVEILAVVGLSHTRPRRLERRNKLHYTYSVHSETLPASLQRALLAASSSAFPSRTFHMQLGWPGQENKDRCITSVTETTQSHV